MVVLALCTQPNLSSTRHNMHDGPHYTYIPHLASSKHGTSAAVSHANVSGDASGNHRCVCCMCII
jgi:hypothetical protein